MIDRLEFKGRNKNESTINCIYSFSSCQFHAHRWYGVFGKKRSKIMYCLGIEFLVLPFVSWFIYIMVGKGPKFSKRRWSKRKQLADKKLEQRLKMETLIFMKALIMKTVK